MTCQSLAESISLDAHGYGVVSRLSSSMLADVLLVRGTKSSEDLFVVKTFALGGLNARSKQSALKEIQLLKKLGKHPCVVCYIESWWNGAGPDSGRLTVVMEYGTAGDLRAPIVLMQGYECYLEEALIKRYLHQMLEGLAFVHSHNVVHRDLKTSNVFLTDRWRRCLLGDFGVSTVLSNAASAQSNVGTPAYMSPELMRNESYTKAVDLWAVGVILYELMAFTRPFEGSSLLAIVWKITNDPPAEKPLRAVGYSEPLIDLTKQFLSKEPLDRPDAAAVLGLVDVWVDFSLEESESFALEIFEADQMQKIDAASLEDVPEASKREDGEAEAGTRADSAAAISPGRRCDTPPKVAVCDVPEAEEQEKGAAEARVKDNSTEGMGLGPECDTPVNAVVSEVTSSKNGSSCTEDFAVADEGPFKVEDADDVLRTELQRSSSARLGESDIRPIEPTHFQELLERLGGSRAAAQPVKVEDTVMLASRTAAYLKRRKEEAKRENAEAQRGICDRAAALKAHNALRKKHGVPPLEWSQECAQRALKRVKQQGQTTSEDTGAEVSDLDPALSTQNVAVGCMSIEGAVNLWYRGISNYDFSNPVAQTCNESFIKLVWCSTRHVGMAARDDLIVADYASGVRFSEVGSSDLATNVLPVKQAFAWSPQGDLEGLLACFFERQARGVQEGDDGMYIPVDKLAAPFKQWGEDDLAEDLQSMGQDALHGGEFLAAMRTAEAKGRAVSRAMLFFNADVNEDGFLDVAELHGYLSSRRDREGTAQEMLNDFDKDCDSALNYLEFSALLSALNHCEGMIGSVLLEGWSPHAERLLRHVPRDGNAQLQLVLSVLTKHLQEGKKARVLRTHCRLVVRQILAPGLFRRIEASWDPVLEERIANEREEIKVKFRELDLNNDGLLDFDELSCLLRQGRQDITDAELQSIFNVVDADASGNVAFEEFVDYVYSRGESGAVRPVTAGVGKQLRVGSKAKGRARAKLSRSKSQSSGTGG